MYLETLCFTCQNAVPSKRKRLGCPWSLNFEPVPGWEAMPSEKHGKPTYCVVKCPQYLQDEERVDDSEELYEHGLRIEAVKEELSIPKVVPRPTFRYSIP